jgi:hypothetical protein
MVYIGYHLGGGNPVNPRTLQVGVGDSVRSLRLASVTMAALLFLAACSGSGSDGTSTTAVDPVTTSATTASPPTSMTSTAPSTSTSTTTSTTLPPDDDVIGAWDSYWQAWKEVRASEDLDPAPLEAVASGGVVDGAIALFERQRSSGAGPVETDVTLHASVSAIDADSATLQDCVLMMPSFTDTVGIWYEAHMVKTGQGWVVDDLRIPRAGGCVPKEMADAAIAGYQAYYDAEAEFWDPPDPSSPLIDDVLVEPQREFILDLLKDHQARGIALRGQPTTHPEVVEVRSPTELVILSCSVPDPAYGLYDMATGARLPDEPAVREGQRDLQSAVMVLDGGVWKVSDFQGQVDFACEFAPTDRGLPSV